MFTRNDYLQVTVQFTVDFLAISANLILLYAIRKRTPPEMRNYSILLANTAMIDTISAISGCLACTRVMNAPDENTVLVFLGPCSFISDDFCTFANSVQAGLLNQSTWLLLLAFFYRLYSLEGLRYHRQTKSKQYIWMGSCVTLMITTFNSYLYYEIAENVSVKVAKQLHIEGYVARVYPRVDNVKAAYSILPNATFSPLLMILIYFIRRRLMKKIDTHVSADRLFHKNIATTLTYQSLLPLGSVFGVSYWSLDKYLALSSEFPQRIVIMIMTFICLASPVINLLYLPPYRKMFNVCKRTVSVERIS